MRFSCQSCGAKSHADLSDVHVHGSALVVTCKTCGRELAVVGNEGADAGLPSDLPEARGTLEPDEEEIVELGEAHLSRLLGRKVRIQTEPDLPPDGAPRPGGEDVFSLGPLEEPPLAPSTEPTAPRAAIAPPAPITPIAPISPIAAEAAPPASEADDLVPLRSLLPAEEPSLTPSASRRSLALVAAGVAALGVVAVFVLTGRPGALAPAPPVPARRATPVADPAAASAVPVTFDPSPPPTAPATVVAPATVPTLAVATAVATPAAAATPSGAPHQLAIVEMSERTVPTRPVSTPAPEGSPLPSGPPDAAAAEAALSRVLPAVRLCALIELRNNPEARLGTVTVTLTVAPSGDVSKLAFDRRGLLESDLGKCLAMELRKAKFSPFAGRPVTLQHAVVLQKDAP